MAMPRLCRRCGHPESDHEPGMGCLSPGDKDGMCGCEMFVREESDGQ